MNDAIVELNEIRRRFPGFELGPLSLQFRPGRIYGLLGPNGAGKTTLLDIVGLQLKPTGGALRSAGEPIRWGSLRWKTRLSYVREIVPFYDELTVSETLRLASRLYDGWDADVAARLVDTLELPLDKRVGKLSKGTKVKLGIASALAHRADLLLLDEPTAGLDPTVRKSVQAIVRTLVLEHPRLCVVLSSHIFEDIEETATDILILRDGRLVFEATADVLRSSTLYRTAAADTGSPSPDLLARWKNKDAEWLLVLGNSALDADLRQSADHLEDHPSSMLAAVYHGTAHFRGDKR